MDCPGGTSVLKRQTVEVSLTAPADPSRSLSYVFIQKGKHIRFPNAYAEEGKIVSVIGRAADWRINFQAMLLAKLRQPCIKRLARVHRIVVRGVDKKYRRPNMCRCSEEPGSQLWRS